MKSTVLWTLIVLNIALLLAFIMRVMPENSAVAQQAAVRPGDYLVLPAEVNGASAGIIVVLDQSSAQLSAISYDESGRKIENMQKVELRQVFQGVPAPARRGAAR